MCDLGTIVETAIEKMKGIVSKIPESFFIKKITDRISLEAAGLYALALTIGCDVISWIFMKGLSADFRIFDILVVFASLSGIYLGVYTFRKCKILDGLKNLKMAGCAIFLGLINLLCLILNNVPSNSENDIDKAVEEFDNEMDKVVEEYEKNMGEAIRELDRASEGLGW